MKSPREVERSSAFSQKSEMPYLDWILSTPTWPLMHHEVTLRPQRHWPVSAIVCKDGAQLSVQCSAQTYCTPRNDDGPWIECEVGFPTPRPPESWRKYFDGSSEDFAKDGTDSVYGYVPVELIREYIRDHGGEDPEATMKLADEMEERRKEQWNQGTIPAIEEGNDIIEVLEITEEAGNRVQHQEDPTGGPEGDPENESEREDLPGERA